MSENDLAWVICPEALHREVYLCTNSTTGSPAMCQRPALQLRIAPGEHSENVSVCGRDARANVSKRLPVGRLQLELHLNLSFCAPTTAGAAPAASGEVGLDVLQSPSGDEVTRIGYNFASGTLFVERGRSSTLPAARPGGGALNATGKQGYGVRSREVAPLPEAAAAGSLRLVVLLDHSILTVFANDAVVITTRVYTAYGNISSGVNFFAEGRAAGVGAVPPRVEGSVTAWPLSL